MSTPSTYSSRHSRTISPPPSTAGTSTISPQTSRLNIVTRLAIEGKAKRDEANVAIKMYLKLTLPVDSITPGSAILLFKEESVKILDHEVHPLDNNSVPYHFSSADSPLLHNAARALNLPARSAIPYSSLFDQSTITSSRASSPTSSNSDHPHLDNRYTGHILVTGYHVSFVLPKEFPPKYKQNGIEADGHSLRRTTPTRSRRGSIGEKNVVMFMAGISLMVPYLSSPPRAPWLLSIPTPRCLQNNLKLRLFPPDATNSSTQSISSTEAETDATWDMTADPHVTRSPGSRRPSSYLHQNFADDESSDSASAPGFPDGVGIQGTFPSTERVRVRWAAPVRGVDDGARDGRRRVGVENARAEMSCTILGRGRDRGSKKDGVLMRLEYTGSCSGIWFPGVATLLGMDIALEAKNAEVTWVRGHGPKWTIVGGAGYTGHEIGGTMHTKDGMERQHSFDPPTPVDEPSAGPSIHQTPTRQDSTSASIPSLLRVSLPAHNVGEFTFDTSATPSEAGMSSLLSADGGSRGRSRAPTAHADTPSPSVPITVHLNINDLLPPHKNVFTVTISGVVLVTPRTQLPAPVNANNSHDSSLSSDSDDGRRELIVSLPRFRVLASDDEEIDTTVRNGIDAGYDAVDVYSSADPKARKAELARSGRSKVSAEGGRVALRPTSPSTFAPPPHRNGRRDDSEGPSRPPSRPLTPSDSRAGSTSALRETILSSIRPRRDGPLMIPSVAATVTPLLSLGSDLPDAYAVHVVLPAPVDTDDEWLEFGLAQPSPQTDNGKPPRVEIASASLDGVPLRYETAVVPKLDQNSMSALAFEQMSSKEWITWVRLHINPARSGTVEVVYIVRQKPTREAKFVGATSKGKEKVKDVHAMNVILPTFNIPVGWLRVDVEANSEFEITSVQSNLPHHQSLPCARRLLKYALEEYFYTQLRVHIGRPVVDAPPIPPSVSRLFRVTMSTAPSLFFLVLFLLTLGMNNDLGRIGRSLDSCSTILGPGWDTVSPTVTVTATVVSRTEEGSPGPTVSAGDASSQQTPITIIDVTSPPPNRPPESEKKPGGKSPYKERAALLPLRHLRLPTSVRIDFPVLAHHAMDTVMDGLSVVWQICRKIYHFPLGPP